ncbi:MAG: DinB family protein [Blastocatellia bacterium]|nr:DinB family protein [Blastocatellia bacterium]
MEAITKAEETAQVKTLENTPAILQAMLAPLTNEHLDWKPSAERWSISEVLAHLEDVELRVTGLRARRIATEDNPLLESYDQIEEAAKGTYSGRDGREQLERFCRARQESLQWLKGLSPGDWQRTGRHPEVGLIRLEQIMNLWAFHDLGHIRQVAELVRAISFWDGIGSLQRYYSVNP